LWEGKGTEFLVSALILLRLLGLEGMPIFIKKVLKKGVFLPENRIVPRGVPMLRRIAGVVVLAAIWLCAMAALMVVVNAALNDERFTHGLKLLLFAGGTIAAGVTVALVEEGQSMLGARARTPQCSEMWLVDGRQQRHRKV
jgi:hypothetical protein